MKTAISIPDPIFKAAEKMARRLGFSRSELYAKAVFDYIQRHRNDKVTEKLDEIYSTESSRLDSGIQVMQSASFDKENW